MDIFPPLLRAPPLLGIAAAVSHPPVAGRTRTAVADEAEIDRLFATICAARVGGAFWAPTAEVSAPRLLIRIGSVSEVGPVLAMLTEQDRAAALWLPTSRTVGRALPRALGARSIVLSHDIDPWSLLPEATALLVHGDDEWAALAHIAGRPVRFLSKGRFGEPGTDPGELRRRVADALHQAEYLNPFTGQDASIESTIAQLDDWRRTFENNRDIVAACGIAWWKRHEIARFLKTPSHGLQFFWSERRAIRHAACQQGAVAVWPSRISPQMAQRAEAKKVPLIRIEDGFVRSVGLGSNLVPPSSIAVDRLGIHYDPNKPSDLETLLAEASFAPALIARAVRLRQVILSAGISKYGGDSAHVFPSRQPDRRLVLVPGQVEDDMSVRLGGGGLTSNLELLRRTRALEPDAEIWFRPHPDVDAGHRKGAVGDADALEHADRVVRGGGMARLLELVDAVHVLTSLTGFEALLRGRDVSCHGIPFYAGWGLTRDLAPISERRGRRLVLDELVAAVLILYPRYLDPVTRLPCPPEILIERMMEGAAHNRLRWITGIRQLQGKLTRQRR